MLWFIFKCLDAPNFSLFCPWQDSQNVVVIDELNIRK